MPNLRKILQFRSAFCDGDGGGQNDAVAVAVATRPFLSRLQLLVIVKVRGYTPTPALPRKRWGEQDNCPIDMIFDLEDEWVTIWKNIL